MYSTSHRAPRRSGSILIYDTAENTKMNDCYFEKKDWRLCKKEVSVSISDFCFSQSREDDQSLFLNGRSTDTFSI